jgi:hypothetical protein
MRTKHLLSFTILVALSGCGDDKPANTNPTTNPPSGDESSSSGDSNASQSDTSNTSNPTTSGTGSSGGTDSGIGPSDPGSSSSGCGFINCGDMPGGGGECDVFAQDCPDGQKCMPWANDGGSSWNATICTPVDAMPGLVGDDCQAEGGGLSGIDTCDKGLICWFLDPENKGTCIDMCEGTPEAPTCPDPGQTCDISNDGVIIVCLDTCNPLVQECPDGQICFFDGVNEFICDFDASGEEGQYQDPCAYINVCDYGLFCADPMGVPDCDSGDGCCAPYCSIMDPQCPMGTMCEPWYTEGTAPPGQEDIGACLIPM